MRYIDVNWLDELDQEPFRLVSEINNEQFEVRKIEFFRTGEIGYASQKAHTKNTRLGIVEVPDLKEINSQNEFQGKNISKQEFEQLWQQHVLGSS